MGRCRFVQPDVVRLYLVDVHRRACADLAKQIAAEKEPDKRRALTDAHIVANAKLEQAEGDADYIDVKRELNAGEHRKVLSRMARDFTPGDKLQLKIEEVGLTKLSAYIIGWSFTDAEGQPVPVSDSAIDNLDQDSYQELIAAVDAHEEAQNASREAERKNLIGRSKSAAISGSAENLDGRSTSSSASA
jgi:hypothetical protein